MARHTVTGDFMDSIRAHFTAAEAAAEPAGLGRRCSAVRLGS